MGVRVTIIQPDPLVPVDRFGPWLAGNGVRLRAVPLWKLDVPTVDTLGSGVIVLGGRMSSRDSAEYPWMDPLKQLMVDAVDHDLPVLAICLGHQLLAEAFGGSVQADHADGPEEGPFRLTWHEEARHDPVLGRLACGGPSILPQSHRDTVTELPPDTTGLAATDRYANQAFRVGSALGVQFHPEASPTLMSRWSEADGGDPVTARRAMQVVDTDVSRNGRLLAQAFVGQVRRQAASDKRDATLPRDQGSGRHSS